MCRCGQAEKIAAEVDEGIQRYGRMPGENILACETTLPDAQHCPLWLRLHVPSDSTVASALLVLAPCMYMLSSVTEAVGACTDEVDGFGNACEQSQSRIHNRCLRANPWMFASLGVRLYGRREHALAAVAAHLWLPQPDR